MMNTLQHIKALSLCFPMLLASQIGYADTSGTTAPDPEQWQLIKHIEVTRMYISKEKTVHPQHENWRSFNILLDDDDIAPNSIVMKITLDCTSKSIRTDAYALYAQPHGQGNIVQSAPAQELEFVPLEDDLAPAHFTYEVFCQP